MFGYYINGIQEGNHLSEKFIDDESRIKKFNGTNGSYLTRSPWAEISYTVIRVHNAGGEDVLSNAYNVSNGCAPLVVLI